MHVLGRPRVGVDGVADTGPTGAFGRFLAADGSTGSRVAVDLDRPHVVSVVGKRGSGKSYTLGVLAEELGKATGVTGVVIDPMGVFGSLAEAGASVVRQPRIAADALPPRLWCDLLELDAASGSGALLWRAASESATIAEMQSFVDGADAPAVTRRAVSNHLALARTWECFDGEAITADSLLDAPVTVLDCSGLAGPALDAIVAAVASALYRRANAGELDHLPWLLVDEAHVPFAGIAGEALRTLLTRGRQPGVSLVLATQRPGALPSVAISQTDLIVAHRLTAERDIDALARASPNYLRGAVGDRLPSRPGEALVIDDTGEDVYTVRVRERETEHGGSSPRASNYGIE